MARLAGLNIRSGLVTQAALFIVHDFNLLILRYSSVIIQVIKSAMA